MKTTDKLEIGNWVEPLYHGCVQITQINKDTIKCDFHNSPEFKIEDVEPLEFNENWLNAFGLKLNEYFPSSIYKCIESPEGLLGFQIATFNPTECKLVYVTHFQYVHEFQNLYLHFVGEKVERIDLKD